MTDEEKPKLTTEQVWELNKGKRNAQCTCPKCFRVGAHQSTLTDHPGCVECDHCGNEYNVP